MSIFAIFVEQMPLLRRTIGLLKVVIHHFFDFLQPFHLVQSEVVVYSVSQKRFQGVFASTAPVFHEKQGTLLKLWSEFVVEGVQFGYLIV